jgi:hypothetical protein
METSAGFGLKEKKGMRDTTRFASGSMFAVAAIIGCCFSALSAFAQQGQDAVYSASGQPTNSPAFIDASMFIGNAVPNNFCVVLNAVLTSRSYPSTGAVIDARALSTANTNMNCSASPWAGISSPPPSTILLPGTGPGNPSSNSIIVISAPWILPSNTHLVGEGDGIPVSNSGTIISAPGTTIQASTSFSGGSAMIEFGSSSICPCSGISVERLTLNGAGQSIDGIDNEFSQTNTFVDHVTLCQILANGLKVFGSGASNSGPYTNIDTGASWSKQNGENALRGLC